MASNLSIIYFASRDLLGIVSDEEYGRFKDMVLNAIQEEWPDAEASVEDGEDVQAEIKGLRGQAEQDVRDRLEDIVNDILDGGAWQDEEADLFGEDEEVDEDQDDDL
ncbi:MAG: hypothetical protein ACREUQ_13405 [Burkholderiales bacterium]